MKLSPLLAQCLINRELLNPQVAQGFLAPRLKNLSDPFLLPGMEAAVTRLLEARGAKERVVIFGDYDVDGITSAALLLELLGELNWHVENYVPSRHEEGYGLTREAAANCVTKCNPRLIIAVDCGSTSADTIDWLQGQGIDVIVLDHHQLRPPIPAARAIVNPHLITDPELRTAVGELCSAGLAFKLAHALVKRGRQLGCQAEEHFDLRSLLDLVALGTIADLVPLRGENRVLAARGLEYLQRSKRPGLIALRAVSHTKDSLGVYEVGFQLGPRLNAAGRLATADSAVRLLTTQSPAEAQRIATDLDVQNRERQRIERAMVEEALCSVRERARPESHVIVEGEAHWHIGVVGIVAARILREYYRPTIVLGGDGELFRGSGRSIEGFDLAAALNQCGDLLVRHGGHAMAAGLTMDPSKIDLLRERLNDIAQRTIAPDHWLPALRLDAEASLSMLGLNQLEELAQLQPCGQGNPELKLAIRNVRCQRPPQRFGDGQRHVRLGVGDRTGSSDLIWWNAGEDLLPDGTFDVAVVPEINCFNEVRHPRLRLLDWRPASSGAKTEAG